MLAKLPSDKIIHRIKRWWKSCPIIGNWSPSKVYVKFEISNKHVDNIRRLVLGRVSKGRLSEIWNLLDETALGPWLANENASSNPMSLSIHVIYLGIYLETHLGIYSGMYFIIYSKMYWRAGPRARLGGILFPDFGGSLFGVEVKKGKPSETLEKRPHAKQRGSAGRHALSHPTSGYGSSTQGSLFGIPLPGIAAGT